MTYLVKITKSLINNIKHRIVTAMGYNLVSATEVCPAGVDCPPVPGLLGVYMETSKKNSPVLLGYINTNQLADPGERRFYATDANGAELSRIWLYDKIEIGGTGAKGSNVNHAVQWEALNTAIQGDIVTFINAQLLLIQSGISGAGGSYTPGTMSVNLTSAKETTILFP